MTAMVLDCGSGITRAGYAGTEAPLVEFESLVSRSGEGRVVGIDAESREDAVCPIQKGAIASWDHVEDLWASAFQALGGDGNGTLEYNPVLITEPAGCERFERERKIQLLFEKFNTSSACLAAQPLLSLFHCNKTRGVIVELGHGLTQVVPIIDGAIQHPALISQQFSGAGATEKLLEALGSAASKFGSTAHERFSAVGELKDKHSYVRVDPNAPERAAVQHTLPDGSTISLPQDIHKIYEPYFDQSGSGASLPQCVQQAVELCMPDLRPQLYGVIAVVGRSSKATGLDVRLRKELKALLGIGKAEVVAPVEHRGDAAWCGGAIVASISTFEKEWSVSKDEYDEYGPSIVHRKSTLC